MAKSTTKDGEAYARQYAPTYAREAPRLAQKMGRYAHAKQYKRRRGTLKQLSTRVGQVMRELERQLRCLDELTQKQPGS